MISLRRRIELIGFAWQDSKKTAELSGRSRTWLFGDILRFVFKYEKDTRDYMKLAYYNKNADERLQMEPKLQEELRYKRFRDEELVFHSKWTSEYWEHPMRYNKRTIAYREHFNAGAGLSVRYGVWLMSTHKRIGELIIGQKVSLGRNTEIDYTGNLTIGNGVDIAERCVILTHGHQYFGNRMDSKLISGTNGAYPTPLSIEDNVFIGAGTYIMPGVKRIGENSIISAGSMVYKQVPPNCVVAGNPAKVIFEMPEGYRTYFKYKKHL